MATLRFRFGLVARYTSGQFHPHPISAVIS
jgi:hypothetical protein